MVNVFATSNYFLIPFPLGSIQALYELLGLEERIQGFIFDHYPVEFGKVIPFSHYRQWKICREELNVLKKSMGKSVGPVIPYKSYKRAAIQKASSKRFCVEFDALYEEFIKLAKRFPFPRQDVILERAKSARSIIERSENRLKYQEIADELQRKSENHPGKREKITAESVRDCIRKTRLLRKMSSREFIEAVIKLFPKSRHQKNSSG